MKEHETINSDLSASVPGIDETLNHSTNGTDNISSVESVNHSTNSSVPDSVNSTDKPKRHGIVNLVSLADRTTEEQRRIAIMGGKASGEARKKKKHLREVVQAMLAHEMTEDQISEVLGTAENLLDGDRSVSAVLTARLIQEAAQGNVKAYETLRDTGGYKPKEEVAVENITEADRALLAKIDRRQSG